MITYFSIVLGKLFIFFSKIFNLGSGSTWPGHIALSLNPNFIKDVLGSHPKGAKLKIIIITGTNGKTTTGKLISAIFEKNNKNVLHNSAGANLLNGLASTLISGATVSGKIKADYLIFESDENAFPEVVEQINPDYIICLNLFRDQLDRYGEIDSISKKWKEALGKLSNKTTLILNADDPQVSYLSKSSKAKCLFFGLDEKGEKATKHGADSIYCPKCSSKLIYRRVFFSHLGDWECPSCGLSRLKPGINSISHFPLSGSYNKHNALSAVLVARMEKVSDKIIESAYQSFVPAFGRGEKIIYKGKNIQIFLSKNPTGFNESLSTIKLAGGKNLLILLNDRIPDGLDVSWIWDIQMEELLLGFESVTVSGERCYDMALRIKYSDSSKFQISNFKFQINEDLKGALNLAMKQTPKDQALYVLPNYSAMLEIRKILTGKKIL
ncbi:MAG: DUF1727 domain-containing protein [Candidatus Levybacteria bacterium]|nr:DUF1727 domain-containing protein [Candidatus Levybacteria bacterium]